MADFNLGTVTAYGYAKDKGYTGTEEEYAELMASYADVAEEAAESAEQAAASATTATTKAGEAANSATAAATAKTAAQTAQSNAETAATTATTKAGEATTAATTATTKASEATTAATTATGKATEAAGSATTATTKAGEASTSATNAAASATLAQEILDSIPEDYTEMATDVSNLKDGLTAVESDVTDLKEDLTGIENLDDNVALSWVIGGLANNGTENSNTNRIRTVFVDVSNSKSLKITIADGYQANVLRFREDKTVIGASSWIPSGNTMSITVTDLAYVRIAVKRNDDADMSTSEGANIALIRRTELLDVIDAVNDDIDSISSNIGTINGNIDSINSDFYVSSYISENTIELSFTNNKFWDLSGDTAVRTAHSSYQASTPVSVVPNEYYQIYAHSGGSLKVSSWAIVDANYKILATGTKTTSQYTKTDEFQIPQNGRYLLITIIKASSPVLIKGVLVPDQNPIYGKTVAIIGDSISTNGNSGVDANVPEMTIAEADVGVQLSAYLTYYDVQAGLSLGGHTFASSEIGTEVAFTPTASDVGKSIGLPNNYNENTVTTWWEVMQEKLNCKCIPNTWSGASITSHEGNSDQYKTSYGWHEATIRKCGIRTAGSMNRTAPDVIIIYRGTNDFSHSPYTILTDGYFDNYNWEYPSTDEVTNGFGYKEGLALMVKKLRATYPNAKIFICTLNVFKRVNYDHFPTNNGINSLPQYNNAIREVADFFGCGVIEFDKDGITFENCYSEGYITDSSTIPTHPSDKGHKAMGLKAIKDIEAQYSSIN